ncbi:MAG: hypothetical protein ACREXR_01690 [Gammaproteobacteria bacterium]
MPEDNATPVDAKEAILSPGPDPLESTAEVAPEAVPEIPAGPAPEPAKPAPIVDDSDQGWEKIDYERLPESERGLVKARVDRLYRQVKTHSSERAAERKFYQNLERKLDEFISDSQTHRVEEKVQLLSERAKKQFTEGNHDEGIKTLRELARIERETVERKPGPQVPVDEPVPAAISEADSEQIRAFFVAHEKILPYDSPEQRQAIDFMRKQIVEEGRPIDETLQITAELTKKLYGNVAKANSKEKVPAIVQQVLGQSSHAQAASNTVESLTPEEKSVAERFFTRLSPEEAHKRYARGKAM